VTLAPGGRLGPYEITAKLGEGGMGEVYRATDTKLKRDVAVKVLPAAFTEDKERLARFEREAQLLAQLHHPNIASIFGLEESDGTKALVMELVEGPTLAERLESGALSIHESLSVSLQIAQALEEAHEKGIVHRDLKPQNIKAPMDGKVKVLDFGLAKAMDQAGSSELSPSQLAHSPTVTFGGTREGVILGTAAYMAPEQARGGAVDKRADIWAFGVVLYEMLTGERLFAEGSVVDTLSAVMRKEIDLGALPAQVPPRLRELVGRCLERDPKRRLRDIGDARWLLTDGLRSEPAPATTSAARDAPAVAPPSSWLGLPARGWALVAALAFAAAAVALWKSSDTAKAPIAAARPLRATIPLPDGLELDGVGAPEIALSPDGSTLALLARSEGEQQKLYLRRLDSDEMRLVPGSETAEGPFFSPDGSWVAFAVGVSSLGGGVPAELRKHSLATGLTQTICPVEDYFGGAWREDGTIFFFNLFGDGPWSVPASGAAGPTRVAGARAEVDGGAWPLLWPALLPDGRSLVAVEVRGPNHEIVVVDLESAAVSRLGLFGTTPRLLPTGQLVFSGPDRTLQAVAFDAAARRAAGSPVAVLPGVAFARNSSATYAAADDGTLVYATGYLRGSRHEPMRVVRASRAGAFEALPIEPDQYGRAFGLSPDGSRLALAREDSGGWVVDLRRGTRTKVGHGLLAGQNQVSWSPDGERLAWVAAGASESSFASRLYVQSSDGRGEPRPLEGGGADLFLAGWTPDGGALIYSRLRDDDGSAKIERQPIDGAPETIWSESASINRIDLSPDGHVVAFEVDAGEGYQIALVDLVVNQRIGVTSAGGRKPAWSRDGRELFFQRDEAIWAVPIDRSAAGAPHVGEERKLFDWPAVYVWTVGPDGSFYGTEPVPGASIQRSLQLRTGWFAEVERLAGGSAKR